jgi:hypothetical protein
MEPETTVTKKAESFITHVAWIGKHDDPHSIASQAAGIMRELVDEHAELLAALRQVRDFYLNADSAWRFSEGFDIDTVCRAIAKAEGE